MIRIFTLNISKELLKFPKSLELHSYFINIGKPLIWIYDEDKLISKFIGDNDKEVYGRAFSYIRELTG